MTRIFILDDHTILRSALRLLLELEEDLEVVGEAGNIVEATALLPQVQADVCLVDLTLTDGTGLDFVHQMKPQLQQVRFLALTMHDEEKFLLAFLQPKQILEVGTAIGFSALLMSEYAPLDCHITTIDYY